MLTIGIDFSQHCGVAWHDTYNKTFISARVLHGSPIYQLEKINTLIGKRRNVVIAYESLNSMRNKRVVESLMGGMGYIRWSLRQRKIPFYSYSVPLIRSNLQIPGKVSDKKANMLKILQEHTKSHVDDNHADALGVLLTHLHKPNYEPFQSYLVKYNLKFFCDLTQSKKEWTAPYN